MTKKMEQETHLLKTKIKDLIVDEGFQKKESRRLLGENATEAAVNRETERRMQMARELSDKLVRPLGTASRPYPMWGSQRVDYNGQSNLEQVLSTIADDSNPMKVYSERPFAEVIAMAYCDMPVPSMLPLFFDGLERRKPESTNRTQMMIGDPGAGKSFMGAMQGRMRSKQPVEVFDCGGKNMNELLFEMVLDFGAGDAMPKAVDKRLQAGTLEALSLAKLKQLPSEAVTFDENNNIKSIDWTFFKGGAKPDEVETAFAILKDVSHIEGLDKASGNTLGMNSQYGPLIRWFIEGREGVLDEYNKSKEGSDNGLQTVWQFLNGETNICTVENPLKNKDLTNGPSSFTFRREDMQAGFFVTLTGNKTEDGLTTRSLNKSVYSRLSPQTLPDPTEADWQHRICQMMCGVPVSTLYSVFREQADENPKEFGQWLMQLRKTKAELEGVPVPELQETLLENWRNVVNSSRKLARFYSEWSEMTNAENLMTTGNTDLIEEVDEEYSKKEGIDFRKIKQHLEAALPIRPHMLPEDAEAKADFKNFLKQPVLAEKEYENPSVAFGTRLVDVLDRMVFEKSEAIGKHKLYEKLKASMDNAGLRDIVLQDGAHSFQRSVEEDLNVSVFDSTDMGKQAAAARKVFCDYIRQVDPQIVEADDDKIITVARLKRALQTVGEKNTAESKELFIINREHESLGAFPLARAKIEDMASYPEGTEEVELSVSDIVSHEDFMAALALPTVSAKNLDAIWDTNIRDLSEQIEKENNPQGPNADQKSSADEIFKITENRSEQGIATTTLRVMFEDASGKESDVSVHIVLNKNRKKALIVGEKVPTKLLSAFKEAGIIHVDRHAPNAKAKVDAALNDLTRGTRNPELAKRHLADAFRFRNDFDLGDFLVEKKAITPEELKAAREELKNGNGQTEAKLDTVLIKQGVLTAAQLAEKTKLSELLVDDKMGMLYEKYVVKDRKKPAL
ncbi:MAG: hypothetical protein KGL10_06935 [Alphaproteobacteria bacterium]|nr:hypothetical protein [Alphaproteobacteria bacterium]MDE2337029.1 hypothetical protein [Alphaproteobacteria bacterium]